MIDYLTDISLEIHGLTIADFDNGAWEALDELQSVDGVIDADIALYFTDRKILITLVTKAADPGEAGSTAYRAVRDAVHQISGEIPAWEAALTRAQIATRPVGGLSSYSDTPTV